MAKRDELLLNTDALMKALLLPLTVAVFLTLQGTAEAAQCEDPMDPEWLTPPVIAPAPADTLAIMNVISHYNWARDEKVSKGFKDLFTTTVVFEACTDGGKVQAAKRIGPDDVAGYLGDLTAFLNLHILKNSALYQQHDPQSRQSGYSAREGGRIGNASEWLFGNPGTRLHGNAQGRIQARH